MTHLAGRCSLRDIVSNLSAQSRKLYHLGVGEVPRSSLARVNAEKPWELFQSLFGVLLARCRPASPGHGVPVQESVALAGFDGDPHGQHGVGAGDGPAHAAALEAVGDDRAAGALSTTPEPTKPMARNSGWRIRSRLASCPAQRMAASQSARPRSDSAAHHLRDHTPHRAAPSPNGARRTSRRCSRMPQVHDLDASRQRLRRRVDPLRAVAGHHAQLPAANPDAAAVRSRRTDADGSTSVSRAAALSMATERRAGPTAPPSPKTPNTATFAARGCRVRLRQLPHSHRKQPLHPLRNRGDSQPLHEYVVHPAPTGRIDDLVVILR